MSTLKVFQYLFLREQRVEKNKIVIHNTEYTIRTQRLFDHNKGFK